MRIALLFGCEVLSHVGSCLRVPYSRNTTKINLSLMRDSRIHVDDPIPRILGPFFWRNGPVCMPTCGGSWVQFSVSAIFLSQSCSFLWVAISGSGKLWKSLPYAVSNV